MESADNFPQEVQELQSYFRQALPGQAVRAVPGEGLNVPIWLLGSSTFSGQLAALLGLPFAFASHFAPDYLQAALELYRSRFRPSPTLEKPYAMLGVNVFAAETDAEATHLFTSLQQAFINLRRGQPGQLQPPVDSLEGFWSPMEKAGVEHALRYAIVGSRETVRRGLAAFIEETGADELMITAQIYDHQARLRSFEIAAELRDSLADSAATAA
jgi:luciferase family oxidoreductase group 1